MNAPAEHLLAAIVGREAEHEGGEHALIEVRRPPPARSEFFGIASIERAAEVALRRSRTQEAWVGMAPRRPYVSPRTGRQHGGTHAIQRVWVLSADCDSDDAIEALERFTPEPSFLLTSGSVTDTGRPKLHAHWPLRHSISRPQVSGAKLRLAHALGSDTKIKDAARCMRLPGMVNHKPDVPAECVSLEDHPGRLYLPAEVLAHTPELAPEVDAAVAKGKGRRRESVSTARADGEVKQAQEQISPRHYVRDLAGVEVGSDGKALCPFHDDGETPNLHAYVEPERGWYCYSCEVGGDIYTFAALLRRIPQRDLHGPEFARTWRFLRTFYKLPIDADAV